MTTGLAALCIAAGGVVIAYALQTAIRTFLLPQPGLSLLSRAVFRTVRPFFDAIDRLPIPAPRRRAWAGIYAPLCLVLIVFAAMVIISLGFTLVLYGLGLPTLEAAFLASISSASTLGFATLPSGMAIPVVATLETMTGILLVALLIGYLPTNYAAVQQCEQTVAALAAHVGTPLSGVAIIQRFARSPGLADLDELWTEWRHWFAALGASHSTLAGIIFVRAPQPERSWVTAAGAVLDAAALAVSTLDPPGDTGAERCLEVGSEALAQIRASTRLVTTRAPSPPDTALHVTQSDFAAAYVVLAASNVPVTPDRGAAWSRFAQRRGQYDEPLHTLARLTRSPLPSWPDDRAEAAASGELRNGHESTARIDAHDAPARP